MRRNWKKYWTAAAVLLCALQMTGCGKESILDPENPTQVVVWNYYNGYQQIAFNDMVERFNETEGLAAGIYVESMAQGGVNSLSEELFLTMNQEGIGQETPNIVCVYPDTAYSLNEKELLVSLDDYFSEEELEEFVPEFLEAGRLEAGGDVKLLPVSRSTEILMYNKTDFDKFAERNNVTEADLMTMEGMAETAEKYYNWTDKRTPDIREDGKALFGRDSLENYIIIGAKQLGHPVLQGNEADWTPDRETFKTLWDYYYIPFINGYFSANGKFRSDDAKTGGILAALCSSSGVGYFPDSVTSQNDLTHKIEIGICHAPVFAEGSKEAIQQGAGFAIIKSEEKEQYAAAQFLKWMVQTEENMKFSIKANYMPVKKEALSEDAMEKFFAAPENSDLNDILKRSMKLTNELVESDKMWSGKPSEHYGEIRSYLADALRTESENDRKTVELLMANGQTRQQAVAEFITDKNFDAWYDNLVNGVQKILKQ